MFIKDLRTFLHLLDAHQGLISGGVILDILMGRTTEEEEYQMTLCVRDEVTARALIRHLREYEAYTICGKDVTVDMSLAIDSDKLPGQRGIFGHPQQATLTSVKKITSVRKRRGADRVVIDIHFFKPHDSLSIQQIRSLRAVSLTAHISFHRISNQTY